jgi:hypothetical protein
MSHTALLRTISRIAILIASLGLFAQQQSQPGYRTAGQPAGMVQPNSPNIVVVPAAPSVYVVNGGMYGAYLTPLSTLPVQETGISLAGRQGISLGTVLQTGAITTVPSPFTFGAPLYSPAALLAGAETTYAGGEAESGRLINDLGPSYYVSTTEPSAALPSLGEVARAYRRGHPRAVRTFTNADAERLSNTVTIPGAAVQPPPPPTPPQPKDHP